MTKILRLLFLFAAILSFQFSFSQQSPIANWNKQYENLTKTDWLIKSTNATARLFSSADKKDIILYNGLVKRTFRLSPNVVCTDYKNMVTGQQLLRAVKPEAIVNINGKEYNVGGLYGQKEKAYLLPEWLDTFTKGATDFQFATYTISELKPFINWQVADWWASNKKTTCRKSVEFFIPK